MHDPGDGHRPGAVFHRLALRAEHARHGVDERPDAQPRGQGEDPERKCEKAPPDVRVQAEADPAYQWYVRFAVIGGNFTQENG